METIGQVPTGVQDPNKTVQLQTLGEAAEGMALNIYENWQEFLNGHRDSFSAIFGLSDRVHAEALPIFEALAGISLAYQSKNIVSENRQPYRDTERRPVFRREQNVARIGNKIVRAVIQSSRGTDRDVRLSTVLAPTFNPDLISGNHIG